MVDKEPFKLAVIWFGDRAARTAATSFNNRYSHIFSALAAVGIEAQPAVYADDMVADVREQLLGVDGVLVWVDPIFGGGNRATLDAMLREVSAKGVLVSAHPDVILKMGTKEILHRTRHLGWGVDTRLYRTTDEFLGMFPRSLSEAGPRVIKQNRGNGGQGVWKVERLPASTIKGTGVRILQATRGSLPEDLPLTAFMDRCKAYFEDGGCVVDQPFQPRLSDGMIRCYLAGDRVVGFGHQLIKALVTPPLNGSPLEPGPRIMHGAEAPAFQALRTKMEAEWVPEMMEVLDIQPDMLPIIWDADFLYGPRMPSGEDSYVLCEINVSCVFPIPDSAPAEIARNIRTRLSSPAVLDPH